MAESEEGGRRVPAAALLALVTDVFVRLEEYRAQGISLNRVTLADLGKAAAGIGSNPGVYSWL